MKLEVGKVYKLTKAYHHFLEEWIYKNSLVVIINIHTEGAGTIIMKLIAGHSPDSISQSITAWKPENIELIPYDIVGDLNEL